MPRTQMNCPKCRQPVVVNLQQLFDVGINPSAKQAILSNSANVVNCPHCSFQGMVASPVVYHDPDKALLLTYVPAELSLPRDEQERAIGALIKQVMDKLPPEKRKAYLLSPQSFFTWQSFIERILEADGITKQMIQDQQQRVQLFRRMLEATSDDVLDEIIKQDKALIDEQFFTLASTLARSISSSGDEKLMQRFTQIQDKVLRSTEKGQILLAQAFELEAAQKSLTQDSKMITRERLLDLIIEATNDTRLQALVSLARPGIDYSFFQMLTNRITDAKGNEQTTLMQLRSKLLDLISDFDKNIEEQQKEARKHIQTLLSAEDVEQAILENYSIIDNNFVDVLQSELEAARKNGDLEKSTKINKMLEVIEKNSIPPEVMLVESMLNAPDEETIRKIITETGFDIDKDFFQFLDEMMNQAKSSQNTALLERTQRLFNVAKTMAK
ncbi:MAG: CpXC domain-containing protein [Chloroflexota bacterium]